MSHLTRIIMLGAITVAAGIAVALLPRMAQPLDYHNFADQRTFLSVPNCLNVISNAPFLIAGVWGLMLADLQPGTRYQRAHPKASGGSTRGILHLSHVGPPTRGGPH